MDRFGFPKEEKLKSRKAIASLFKKGKRIKRNELTLIYDFVEVDSDTLIQTGFSVPKKVVKAATKRNLIKRRLREAYRLNNQKVKALLRSQNKQAHFMFIYHAEHPLAYQEIENKLVLLLNTFLSAHEKSD